MSTGGTIDGQLVGQKGVLTLTSGALVFANQGSDVTIGSKNNKASVNFTGGDTIFKGNIVDAIGITRDGTKGTTTTLVGGITTSGTLKINKGNVRIGDGQAGTKFSSNVNISSADSQLILDLGQGTETMLTKIISGQGQLVNQSGNLTVTSPQNYSGGTQINHGTISLENGLTLGTGGIYVAKDAGLSLVNTQGLNQALTGAGLVSIDSTNQEFKFGAGIGTGFKGEFAIKQSEIEMNDANHQVFAQSSVTLNNDANLTVASDTSAKTVTLNEGSSLNLSGDATTLKANGTLSVDALNLKAGQINIDLANQFTSGTQMTDGQEMDASTVFDQGTGRVDSMNLITSKQAVTLDQTKVMLDGKTVDVAKGDKIDVTKSLKQSGDVVAKVHYGEGISTQQGAQHGLFVTQGLHSVEALQDKTVHIAVTEKSKDKVFNTLVTGEGGVSLDASKGTMNFGHEGNSYQGGTTVTAGTVKLAEKEGFGVGAMTVAKDAAVDLNGQQQTITTLNNEGSLNLNQGALTITGNTDIAGVTGAGQLAIQGVSTVKAVNQGLTANIAIDQTGTLNLNVDNGLGQGQMALVGTLNANSDLTLANQLSGAGQLNINKAVTLTSDNAAFTGNININQAGTLTVSDLPQLGNGQKIEIAKEGDLVLNKISDALNQALSGGGDVVIADGSQITLTGNNADFSGVYKVQGVHQVPSTLTVTDAKQLGKGSIYLNDAGMVNAQYTDNNWQTNVTGTGIVNVADHHQITLTDPSKLADTLTVNVSEHGQLNLNDDAFNSALTGNGVVKVDAGKNDFTFGDQVGTKFAGTFDINNANFTLYPTNHAIVQNANIIANAGSVISVESQGVTKTKNFTLNDRGVLHFTGKINDHSTESGTLEVKNLTLNKGGLVKVEAEGYQPGKPDIPYDGGNLSAEELFSRSIKDRTLQLVFADQVTKAEGLAIEINGEKVLLDDDQNTASTRVNVQQNNEVVGVVDYISNAATQSGDQKGLFITSGLHQVDIAAGKSLQMASTAGSEQDKVELLVVGAGGLVLNAAKANMQFGNIGNTYKGDTKVTAGTVTLIADNAFGEAAHLDVAQGAVVNLGGKTQEINQLNNNGTVALEKGTLNVTDSSTLQGLTGEGQLLVSGGEATVNAVNQGLAAKVAVKDAGALNLNVQDGLGQGDFAIDGTLNVGNVETLRNNLSGQGSVNINESLALSGTNTDFTGNMNVQAQKAVSIASAGNLGKSELTLGDQSALNINGTVGELSGTVKGNGRVNIQGNGQLMIKNQDQFSKTVGMNVDKNATLNLETTGFDSALTGEGLVSINAQQGDFALGKKVGNAFAGTVAIANGQVALNQENAQTLSNANVALDAEGQLTVAADASAKTIAVKKGSLALSGDAATGKADGLLTTDALTIDGGTIDLTVKGFGDDTGAIDADTESLFNLASDGKQLQFIATKDALDISQADIALNGQNMVSGSETATNTAINASGEQVANAVYSNRISTAQKNQNGLFLDSHLSSIDILDQKNLTIRGEQGQTQAFATTMTGQGAATFDATKQALTISGQNSYTGGTTVKGGVVTAQNGQAFGDQGALDIQSGATLALGADLTVGQTTANGDVSLQDHALSFTKGDSTLNGKVSGNGQLNVMANSTLNVSDQADLGTAKLQIAKDGRTNIDKTADYTFNQALSGEGELKLSAAGNQLSIGDQVGNDFKGTLLVEFGKLSVDGTKLKGSSLSVEKDSEVTILKDTTHKNVTVNGGDLIFKEGNSPERADGIITAENLNLNNGTVSIEVKKDWTTTTPTDGITLDELLKPTHLYQLGQASGNISISQKDMTLDLIINGQHIDNMTKPVQHTVTLKDGRKVLVDQNYFLGHDQLITQNGPADKGLYAKYGNQKLTFVEGLDNDKDHNIDTGGSTVSGGDGGVDNKGTINTGGGNTETDKGDINNKPDGTINTGGGDVTNNGDGNTNNGGTINTGGGDVTNKGKGDINNDPDGTIITDGGNVGTNDGNINNKGEIDTSKPNDKGGDVTAGKDINNTKPGTNNPNDGTITTGGGKVEAGGDLNNKGDIDTSSPKDDQGHTIVDNNGKPIPGGNVDVGGVLVNGDKDGQPNTGTIHTGGGDVTVKGNKNGTDLKPGDNALTNNKGSDINTGGMTDPQGKPLPGGDVVVNNGDIDNHGTITTEGGKVGTDNGNIKNHDTGTITTDGGDVTVGGKDTTLTNDGSIHTGGGNATTNDGDINNNPGGTIITDGGKVEAGGDHNINNKGEIDTSKPNEKGGDVIAGKDINNTDPGTGNSKDGTITTGGGQVVAGGDLNNKGDIDTSSPKDDQGHTIVDNNGKPIPGGNVDVGGVLVNGDKDGKPNTGTIHTGGGDVTVTGNKNGTDLKPGDNALTNNKGSDINTGGMTDPQGKPLPGGDVVVKNGDIDNHGTITTEGGKVGTDNGNIKNHETGTITTGGGEVVSSGNVENTGQVDTAAPKDDQGHTIVDNNGQPVKGGDVNVGGILINGDKDGKPTGTIHTGGGNVTVTGTNPDGTPVQPGDDALTNNKGSDINTGGMTDPQGKPLPGGDVVVNNGDLDNHGTITTEGGNLSVDNGSIKNHDTGTITTGGGNIAVNKDVNNDGLIDLGGGEMNVEGNFNNNAPKGTLIIGQKEDGSAGKVEVDKNFNNTGKVDFGGGELVIKDTGSTSSDGVLTGDGTLTIDPNAGFTVKGKNDDLGKGTNVNIADQGKVTIEQGGSLGGATIDNSGELTLQGDKVDDNAVKNSIKGNGHITIEAAPNTTQGKVELAGGNQDFGGEITVTKHGDLIIRNDMNRLGGKDTVVDLSGDPSNLTIIDVPKGDNASHEMNQTIKGTGNMNFDNSKVNITSENKDFKGQVNLNNGSEVSITDNARLGSPTEVMIDGASGLVLDGFKDDQLTAKVGGSGDLIFTNGTKLDSDKVTIGEDIGFNLRDKDTVLNNQDGDFNHRLKGEGSFNVMGNGGDFTFGEHVGSEFAGTVNLENTNFTITDGSADALSHATLNINKDATMNFGDHQGDVHLDQLHLQGGSVVFNNGVHQDWAVIESNNVVHVDALDLSQQKGGITVEKFLHELDPSVKGNSLIELNVGEPAFQLLATKNGVKGALTGDLALTLKDDQGQAISTPNVLNLTNKGTVAAGNEKVVAEGSFDYGLSTGAHEDGLYVSYQMKDLTILDGNTVAIEGVQGRNNTLTANIGERGGKGGIEVYNDNANNAVTLSGQNTFSGDAFVRSGGLKVVGDQALGQANRLVLDQGSFFDLNGTTQKVTSVEIADNARFFGTGTMHGDFMNQGLVQVGNPWANNGKMRMKAASPSPVTLEIQGNFTNANTIDLRGQAVGNALVIHGNYVGQNGLVNMNVARNGQTVDADQLVITGHASGQTKVTVYDVSGLLGKVDDAGVKLISTGGSDANAFTLGNLVTKGAYQYQLTQADKDWFLKSLTMRPDTGNNLSNTGSTTQSQVPGLGGPGFGGGLINGAGGLRSLSRLQAGGSSSEDAVFLDSSLWNTTAGGKHKGRTSGGTVHYDYDYYNTTFGGDQLMRAGNSLVQLGVFIGTMEAKSDSHSIISGSHGKGKVTGQTYGIYGSWYADGNNPLTPYVDGILSYGSYQNKITTEGNPQNSYRSHVWSFTLQGGYPIDLGNNLVIEPQAQITYLDFSAKDYVDVGGTRVSQSLKGDVVGRVGAFIYPKDGDIRPYAGMNLWYDDTRAVVYHNNDRNEGYKGGLMYEAKAGVGARLDKNFSLSVDANYRQGKHKAKDYGASLTLKYTF